MTFGSAILGYGPKHLYTHDRLVIENHFSHSPAHPQQSQSQSMQPVLRRICLDQPHQLFVLPCRSPLLYHPQGESTLPCRSHSHSHKHSCLSHSCTQQQCRTHTDCPQVSVQSRTVWLLSRASWVLKQAQKPVVMHPKYDLTGVWIHKLYGSWTEQNPLDVQTLKGTPFSSSHPSPTQSRSHHCQNTHDILPMHLLPFYKKVLRHLNGTPKLKILWSIILIFL